MVLQQHIVAGQLNLNLFEKNRISLLFIVILCIMGWPWPWHWDSGLGLGLDSVWPWPWSVGLGLEYSGLVNITDDKWTCRPTFNFN